MQTLQKINDASLGIDSEVLKEISLKQDPRNPFRTNVFTPNPSSRYNHYWGCLVETERGWVGVHHLFRQTHAFSTAQDAAVAVVWGHLYEQDWEQFGASEVDE